MPKISLFRQLKSNVPNETVEIDTVLEWIKNNIDNVRYLQDRIRTEKDEKKRKLIKNQLPAVTWSGVFSKRNKELKYLAAYSGIICIDIDKLGKEELKNLRNELAQEQHFIYSYFVSPSGNGLKILFKVDAKPEQHEEYFQAICRYIVNNYGVIIDEACRDISRLCFLAQDDNIYINPNPVTITEIFLESNPAFERNGKVSTPIQPLESIPTPVVGMDYMAMCDTIARKTHQPVAGQYNFYIATFAIFANRYGIDINSCIYHLQNSCAAHDTKETSATVKSTYAKFAHENGAWLKAKPSKGKKPVQKNTATDTTDGKQKEEEQLNFWYEVISEKSGNIEYKFSYDNAIMFLQKNGFYRYPLDNDFYQFVHIKEDIKQVEVIQPIKIKDFFLTFLKKQETSEYKAVREMFRRGAKNYCSINLLDGLEYKKPTFKKDTATTGFVYFKNCYLEITANKIQTKKYTSLDNHIWSKQVIDFEYTATPYEDADFVKFVTLAILGKKINADELDDIQIQKIESFSTTIGYLLHRYKNPALTKAVVAVDKRLRSSGENNGRTGKSLLSKALVKMLNVCHIDGKNFKFDAPFPFQKANIDTELINFNDVLKNFDFERLYGMITEEFTFEKKGKDSITLAFEDAPKFYISTNTTLKGSGESNKGRQQIIEFDNYFNTEHTPVKEFGRMFFYDWDSVEYSKFYTYMVECIQYYLENGLIDFPLENYEINKLIDTAGEEFIEFMNEEVLERLDSQNQHENKELFDKYIAANKHRDKTQIKTFNKNVKVWATINNLDINAHKNGDRDKRGPHTFLTFTAARIISN